MSEIIVMLNGEMKMNKMISDFEKKIATKKVNAAKNKIPAFMAKESKY